MKPKHIGIVACLALMTAAPASAQQSSFTNSVLLAANPCFNASGAQPPAAVINICAASEEDLSKLMRANVAPDATDLAVYRAMRSIVVITIGGAQARKRRLSLRNLLPHDGARLDFRLRHRSSRIRRPRRRYDAGPRRHR